MTLPNDILRLSPRRARAAIDEGAVPVWAGPIARFDDHRIDGAIARDAFAALSLEEMRRRPLVIYDRDGADNGDGAAARLAVELRDAYALEHVAVLDGGHDAWLREAEPPSDHPSGNTFGVPLIAPALAHDYAGAGALLVCAYEELARFQSARLPDALSRGEFEAKATQLPTGRQLIMYDDDAGDGDALALAKKARDELGFVNVAVIDGGLAAWRQAGLPEPTSPQRV